MKIDLIIMEDTEKILDPEDLFPVHQGECSQSSGMISLPSANKLADLSLASDLIDSEVENEATIQTPSAHGGHQDHSNDKQFEKNVKASNNLLLKSSMLVHSQRLDGSLRTNQGISDRLSEGPSAIIKERTRYDNTVSNEKASNSFFSDMIITEDERITDMPTVSLDDVKASLQQNCNLLSDRHLLKDLLKSLDNKIEQEPVADVSIQPNYLSSKQKITLAQKDFLDNSLEERNYKQMVFNRVAISSPKSQSNNCESNDNFGQRNNVATEIEFFVNPRVNPPDNPKACETLQENLHIALVNSSPAEQQALQKCTINLATQPDFGRHVKFQSTTSRLDPLVPIEGKEYGDNQKLHCGAQQSLNVLKKLAGLRWGLMGWEDVSSSPPDSNSSLTFLYHLLNSFQALQLEKKHLKEELTTTLKKFKDLSEESNTKQQMYEKRETRVIEVDRQLGQLQQDWKAAQEVGQQETSKLRAHCHFLKQENAILRKEGQCLRNNVMKLKSITEQNMLMKTQMLETEELLAASKKKTAEVLEENKRVNFCLEENKKYIQELEEVKVPKLLGELEDVKVRARKLEDSNEQLCLSKAQVEEDLRMLQEQHELLLKRIVEEQEDQAKTEQKKSTLEDEMKELSGKMTAMKTQLHLHYQAQVEDLVTRKSAALQEQLKMLETNLQKNFEEQLKIQMTSHQVACKKLQERYEEEIRDTKSSYDKQLEKFHCKMGEVGQENHRLHQQRQGVISAVSSILGLEHQTSVNPLSCWSSAGPGSSRQAGASISSLDEVKDGSLKTGILSTSGKKVGNLPYCSFENSSSSDTESIMFPEGKQTVRHLGGHSQCTFHRDALSQNSYHENQKNDFVASSDSGMNPKQGACEFQSLSSMHMKANSPQAQLTSCSTHPESTSLKLNLCQNCKNQNSFAHKKSPYPTKIRRASEILQATDFSDEDVSYQDGDDMLFTTQENEEMAKILKELRMQKSQSTQGSQSDAPTHDTSLDQDTAALTLHRLSQLSSVLSHYAIHS